MRLARLLAALARRRTCAAFNPSHELAAARRMPNACDLSCLSDLLRVRAFFRSFTSRLYAAISAFVRRVFRVVFFFRTGAFETLVFAMFNINM